MTIHRRTFLTSAMGGYVAAAAGVLDARDNDPQPRTAGANRMQFVLTGLGMLETWTASKRAVVSLVNPAAAGLDVPHAALMIVNYNDYVPPISFGTPGNGPARSQQSEPYYDPQIIRVGATVLGVWGLAGCKVWVDEAQPSFSGLDARGPSFSFRTREETHRRNARPRIRTGRAASGL